MSQPGDRKPTESGALRPDDPGPRSGVATMRPRSMVAAVALAIGVAVLAALAWGLLRGILDLGIGLLALAAVGGWGIAVALRQVASRPLLAMAIAAAAWLLGLIFTWLVSMAILVGSSRTFTERIEATPFLDWMSPQFGLLEVAGLALYVGAAAYGSRPRR